MPTTRAAAGPGPGARGCSCPCRRLPKRRGTPAVCSVSGSSTPTASAWAVRIPTYPRAVRRADCAASSTRPWSTWLRSTRTCTATTRSVRRSTAAGSETEARRTRPACRPPGRTWRGSTAATTGRWPAGLRLADAAGSRRTGAVRLLDPVLQRARAARARAGRGQPGLRSAVRPPRSGGLPDHGAWLQGTDLSAHARRGAERRLAVASRWRAGGVCAGRASAARVLPAARVLGGDRPTRRCAAGPGTLSVPGRPHDHGLHFRAHGGLRLPTPRLRRRGRPYHLRPVRRGGAAGDGRPQRAAVAALRTLRPAGAVESGPPARATLAGVAGPGPAILGRDDVPGADAQPGRGGHRHDVAPVHRPDRHVQADPGPRQS